MLVYFLNKILCFCSAGKAAALNDLLSCWHSIGWKDRAESLNFFHVSSSSFLTDKWHAVAKVHTALWGEGSSCTQSRHERGISQCKSRMSHCTSLREQRGGLNQPCQRHTRLSCSTAGLKSAKILLISRYFLLIYHPKSLGLGINSSLSAHSLIICPLSQRSRGCQGDFNLPEGQGRGAGTPGFCLVSCWMFCFSKTSLAGQQGNGCCLPPPGSCPWGR